MKGRVGREKPAVKQTLGKLNRKPPVLSSVQILCGLRGEAAATSHSYERFAGLCENYSCSVPSYGNTSCFLSFTQRCYRGEAEVALIYLFFSFYFPWEEIREKKVLTLSTVAWLGKQAWSFLCLAPRSASSAKEDELVNKTKREAKYHHLLMRHGFTPRYMWSENRLVVKGTAFNR